MKDFFEKTSSIFVNFLTKAVALILPPRVTPLLNSQREQVRTMPVPWCRSLLGGGGDG